MAKGCDHCRGKGADGRTGVFEMLEIGKEERRLLHENAAAEEFSECMRKQGQYSLKESLLRLMESGAVPPRSGALMGVTRNILNSGWPFTRRLQISILRKAGRVIVREYGGLKELEERAEKSFFDMLFHSCLSPDKRKVYEEKGACDTSFSIGENRFRLHLYRAGGKDCAALRVLPVLDRVEKDPDEKWLEKIAKLSSGLVLFSGPTGSGKSTTMARALEGSARKKQRHIVTLGRSCGVCPFRGETLCPSAGNRSVTR